MLADVFGYVGGVVLAINTLPQIYKIYKTKSTNDLSYSMFFVSLFGYTLYIIYGVMIKSIPIIISVSFSSLCVSSMMYLKYKKELQV